MKFLFDFNPMTGFSSLFGTEGFFVSAFGLVKDISEKVLFSKQIIIILIDDLAPVKISH